MLGNIHSIETFGTVDGPNIRYVIFLQGCPMRCGFCHNPDTWNIGVGENKSVDEIVKDVLRYTRYIDGITVTGGEPLLQIEFITKLFENIKEKGLTTCLDTSGITFNKSDVDLVEKIDKLLKVCDLVLLDIKHIDDSEHQKLTGHSNKNVLEFAKYLDEKGVKVWLRYVLVPGINDSDEVLFRWKDFADNLSNVEKIEVLPYHKLGIEKYKKLGIDYRFKDVQEPTLEVIKKAKEILKKGEN